MHDSHTLRSVQDVMTAPEVARLLRVDPSTVTRWATAGKLAGFRTPGGEWRFRADVVTALVPDQES